MFVASNNDVINNWDYLGLAVFDPSHETGCPTGYTYSLVAGGCVEEVEGPEGGCLDGQYWEPGIGCTTPKNPKNPEHDVTTMCPPGTQWSYFVGKCIDGSGCLEGTHWEPGLGCIEDPKESFSASDNSWWGNSCGACNVRCILGVVKSEAYSTAVTAIIIKALKKKAKQVAAQWAAKAIPVVRWVAVASTALSIYGTVNCVIDCARDPSSH